ncbi:MAG TPA: 4-hydroxyphenylacetate 3-hydroxylase N-terminal domain-containing protein [Paracoccaceae bacterium]|nr:4-hydroxyphenylacetate 3-hydroxylase N-terminal domain-containing protein [Paracoccaceae bacterium]
MLMTGDEYRESLRALSPRVFVNGKRVENVADEPLLAPGVNAIAHCYDAAHDPRYAHLMTALEETTGKTVNRMNHIDRSPQDLIEKLEAVRLLCREVGCAMRYLTHDGLCGVYQATHRMDAELGTDYHPRLLNYLHHVQDNDLTVGIAMTDGKGDRSLRPHAQPNADAYVHITERRPDGIVIRGAKAIVTSAAYVHELLVMPCRAMTEADADFAVCCAAPIDAPGLTVVSRPAGRPGESAAKFSARYGQATGVCIFDDVFVPWERVFLAGEWRHSQHLTSTYATHHRHSCIGARAGFGDLLIGAGVLMIEANGLDVSADHLRNDLVELIKIVEGFYACGVAASVYGFREAGVQQPDGVFANVGKLMMATQIYEMHRLAHDVSGGLIVALPGPDEDHNPETRGDMLAMLAGNPAVPAGRRMEVARLMHDLTASDQAGWMSVISLHGGGSPEAMRREIYRYYPLEERRALVEKLLDRGVLDVGQTPSKQPGRCCPVGCQVPETPVLGGAERGRLAAE